MSALLFITAVDLVIGSILCEDITGIRWSNLEDLDYSDGLHVALHFHLEMRPNIFLQSHASKIRYKENQMYVT